MSEDTVVTDSAVEAGPAVPAEDDAPDEALLESLLVEEVSIDGMCGVY
jgi:mycofactocin precursor